VKHRGVDRDLQTIYRCIADFDISFEPEIPLCLREPFCDILIPVT